LPADRAVVVCFPAHAAEHCTRQEHRAAPPAVEPQRACRFAETQVELEARFDVGERYARQRHAAGLRSEEHTSEFQSLMRISYAVFCLQHKKTTHTRCT